MNHETYILLELSWIKIVQHDSYNWKQFKQLNVDLRFFIEVDILRCKTWISKASLPYDSKNPIFLPEGDFLKLLVKIIHSRVLYNGVKDRLVLKMSDKQDFGLVKHGNLLVASLKTVLFVRKSKVPRSNIHLFLIYSRLG